MVQCARSTAGVLVLMGSILLGAVVGQGPGLEGEAEIHGQWGGPYNLEGHINPLFAGSGLATHYNWEEFAHIAALPPPNDGLVLLWSRRHDLGLDAMMDPIPIGDITQDSYIWDKNEPTNLTVIPVGNAIDGSNEMFCAGHTFTKNGQLFVAGGTNVLTFGTDNGTKSVHIFDNADLAVMDPSWIHSTTNNMDIARYYPTATRLDNGDILVGGHEGAGHTLSDKSRERAAISLPTITWDAGVVPPSNFLGFTCPSAVPGAEYKLNDYPRWHLLGAMSPGLVMRTSDRHSFLKFGICAPAVIVGDDDRFDEPPPQMPSPAPKPATSVHLLYHDGVDMNEVVYAIGGGNTELCGSSNTNAVVKMVNPGPAATWVSAASMNMSRVRCNAVILLDGSILVVGGYGWNPTTGDCVGSSRRAPELYRTPEIFGNPSAVWQTKAAQAHDRRYHSVTTMLPDGSVVSAGGVDTDLMDADNYPLGPGERQASMWSIERFKPPYFFSTNPRPRLGAVPSTPVQHGSTFEIDVNMFNTAGFDYWIALVAPGTATHGFDMNQRYIRVKSTVVSRPTPGEVPTIEVTVPDRFQAPPGHYMITAVNENELPSRAQWIQIVP